MYTIHILYTGNRNKQIKQNTYSVFDKVWNAKKKKLGKVWRLYKYVQTSL